MDTLTRDALNALIEPQAGLCVSIYLPTQRAGVEHRQNQIRLRHALYTAETSLEANGLRGSALHALLAPAEALVTDSALWRRCGHGLAIYASSHTFQHHCAPLAFAESVVVGRSFNLTPLLPLLAGDAQYYVLALSQNAVRLFHGTRDTLDEVPGPHLPHSLTEMFKDVEMVRHELQSRSAAAGRRAAGSALFYRSGDPTQAAKEQLLQYCRAVEHGLHADTKEPNRPLVLAGVTYLLALFRQVSRYRELVPGEIPGNPDRLSAQALHARAWPLAQAYFENRQAAAVAHYHQARGSAFVSANVDEIVSAAGEGRIATLFLASHREAPPALRWNEYPRADDHRLGTAAVTAWLKGGALCVLDPDKMPDQAPCAAVLRC